MATSSADPEYSAVKVGDILHAGDMFVRYVHPHNSSIVAGQGFKFDEKAMLTAKMLIGDLVHEYNRRPVEKKSVPLLLKQQPF